LNFTPSEPSPPSSPPALPGHVTINSTMEAGLRTTVVPNAALKWLLHHVDEGARQDAHVVRDLPRSATVARSVRTSQRCRAGAAGARSERGVHGP
jgi:hypothetical protein